VPVLLCSLSVLKYVNGPVILTGAGPTSTSTRTRSSRTNQGLDLQQPTKTYEDL